MFKFETLNVWKKSIKYCNEMINISSKLPYKYRNSFSDQLLRASISIPNNIAEGSGRCSIREINHFYNIAKGSTYETVNLLLLLKENKLLEPIKYLEDYNKAEEICKMLSGLIKK